MEQGLGRNGTKTGIMEWRSGQWGEDPEVEEMGRVGTVRFKRKDCVRGG